MIAQEDVVSRRAIAARLKLAEIRLWRWDWLACLGVGLVALTFFTHDTRGTSLYFDEAYSVALARQDPAVLWRYIWGPEQNMAIYYVLLHLWLALLQVLHVTPSELALRLPTIVCMALAAVVVLRIGWRFWNPMAGVVAAGLFSLNPLILQFAQEARAYGLQVLLLCLSWYAVLAILEAPSERRWWAAFAGMSAIAVYAQLTSVFVILSQMLILLGAFAIPNSARQDVQHVWRPLLASLAGLSALIVPMGIDAVLHGGNNAWVPPATPQDALNFLLVSLCRSSAALAVGLVISSLGALAFERTLATASLGSWLLVPVALSYGLTQPYFNAHVFWPRYLIASAPALCLLAGVGVSALSSRCILVVARLLQRPYPSPRYTRWVAPGIVLCLLLLAARIPSRYYATAEIQNFRQPLTWLVAHFQTGDGLICHPEGALCAAPLDYYLQIANSEHQRFPTQYAGDWPVAGGPMIHTTGPALMAYLEQHPRVFLVSAMLGDFTHQQIARRTLVQSLLGAHYQEIGRYSTPSVQVYLYERSG